MHEIDFSKQWVQSLTDLWHRMNISVETGISFGQKLNTSEDATVKEHNLQRNKGTVAGSVLHEFG